jgi:hypothetical protein
MGFTTTFRAPSSLGFEFTVSVTFSFTVLINNS